MDSSSKKKVHITDDQEKRTFTSNLDQEDYQFQKRLPPTFPRRKNDVYINQKSPFIAQFSKCKSLLSNGEKEICIHGLGASVNTAVNLALQLKSYFLDTVVLDTNTSTVNLVDDYIPTTNKGRHRTEYRKNSAILIKIRHVTNS